MDDLRSLLLGGLHAVGGGAVGLRDALAGARFGLLAQLRRGALGGLHDARNPRRRGAERFATRASRSGSRSASPEWPGARG